MSAPPPPSGPGSRTLVVLLMLAAAIVTLLPWVVARTRRVQAMRSDLTEVLAECRARYAAAVSPGDTAAADAWQPPLHGNRRPGDPPCGPYRYRNMIPPGRP